jgi:hypothetical protein
MAPHIERALSHLASLDLRNLRPGADLRLEAERIVKGIPTLEEWLAASEEFVVRLDGAKRLCRRRRRGILRQRSVPGIGFPHFSPQLIPTARSPEPRLFYLRDELEIYQIQGRYETARWRPVREMLTFDDVRALADLPSGTLYRLTSKGSVPGMMNHQLSDGSRMNETRFDCLAIMNWGRVLRALVR